MRKKWQGQIPFMAHIQDHPQSQELVMVSNIIDGKPTICQHLLKDLNKGKLAFKRSGAGGMSADPAIPVLDSQREIYGRYPLKVIFDGGFASKNNLNEAKSRKIKDLYFAKKRGPEKTEMCRSEHVYHRLRNVRAGIESGMSW